MQTTTYDVHAHAAIPAAAELAGRHAEATAAARLEADIIGADSMRVNAELMGGLVPRLTDPERRLADMDAAGIDVQVVSPLPTHFHPWADRGLSEELGGAVNEGIAEHCSAAPDRLLGMGLVSQHHAELACAQLEDAVGRLGLVGVEVISAAAGHDLSDVRLEPFWAAAAQSRALVLVHPWACSLGAGRLNQSYLANSIGQPIEATAALAHLIFSGVLDRHPGLRLVMGHGGGYLPFHIGRADHAWSVRPDAHTCELPPSAYLRRVWFDSVVHDHGELRMLVDRVGADRVLLGSDHPFDMGLAAPVAHLDATPGLTDDERAAIGGSTLADLLPTPTTNRGTR